MEATQLDAIPAPPPLAARHALARASERWNPFYVLSAFSMLASCYALEYDFMIGPESLGQIVPLAALQIYELLVLATAIFLVRSGRAHRDARMLVLIEVPFLVDVTYFLGEAAAFSPRAGAWLAAAAFLLALGKLAAVNAGEPPGGSAHLVVLLATPTPRRQMRAIGSHSLHPLVLHAAWWAVAAVLATKPDHLLTRHVDAAHDLGHSVEALFRRMLLAALALSLVGHLAVLHFGHDAVLPWQRGTTAASPRCHPERFASVAASPPPDPGDATAAVALNPAMPRSVLRPVPALVSSISPYWLAIVTSAALYVLAFLRIGSNRPGGRARGDDPRRGVRRRARRSTPSSPGSSRCSTRARRRCRPPSASGA
ncbi:MAG: hypothetical protein IPK07_14820 [Deltaproteobacteria bacterium]|nr:hypothetical protein [Deltaproteobacteria bacterium]